MFDFEKFENEQNFRMAMEELDKLFPQMIEMFGFVAKLRREYYNQCIAQGFTSEQALTLTLNFKIPGLNL